MSKEKYEVCQKVNVKGSNVVLKDGTAYDFRETSDGYKFYTNYENGEEVTFDDDKYNSIVSDINKEKESLIQMLREVFKELFKGLQKDKFPVVSHEFVQQMQEMAEEMIESNAWAYAKISDSLNSFKEDIEATRSSVAELPEDKQKIICDLMNDISKTTVNINHLNEQLSNVEDIKQFLVQWSYDSDLIMTRVDGNQFFMDIESLALKNSTQGFTYNPDATVVVLNSKGVLQRTTASEIVEKYYNNDIATFGLEVTKSINDIHNTFTPSIIERIGEITKNTYDDIVNIKEACTEKMQAKIDAMTVAVDEYVQDEQNPLTAQNGEQILNLGNTIVNYIHDNYKDVIKNKEDIAHWEKVLLPQEKSEEQVIEEENDDKEL